MWPALIAALMIMSALTILQTPREWLRRRPARVLLFTFHGAGLASILLLLFAVWRMEDGFFREAIVWTETVYVIASEFALILSAVRYFGFELARHFRHRKILRLLGSHTAFFLAVVLITASYMVPSVHHAANLKTVSYDIRVNKSCEADTLRVAVVSDFHIGAGARHSEMDQMVERLTAAEPELILIGGDVCDSSSSESDLSYMQSSLQKLSCRYGVFYVEGNHEAECRTDPAPYLLRAGVTILRDEAVRLPNGVVLIGRKNALEKDASQIAEDAGLAPTAPVIVLQHRTKGLSRLEGVADLVICGHTHGYQFPFMGVMMPYQRDISYGHRMYGETHAIVTAGVSEWGYRTKWPSQSEVALINMTFQEAEP